MIEAIVKAHNGGIESLTKDDEELLRSVLTKNYSLHSKDRLTRNLTRFFIWVTLGEKGWSELVVSRAGRTDPRRAIVAESTARLSREFLGQGRLKALSIVARYRDFLKGGGYAPATVNSYLWAVREMVAQAHRLEIVDWSLKDIEGVPAQTLRDTKGTSVDGIQAMLRLCDRTAPEGSRNYALLLLLFQNALRRGEVEGCNVGHFDGAAATLSIQGKGRSERESIDLSPSVVAAIADWLDCRGAYQLSSPLFCALDINHKGARLTGTSIYRIVRRLASQAGVSDRFSPHKVRHSAITALLDMTDGDLRSAQALSRHKSIEILRIYDDNRAQLQGKASSLLEQAVGTM